MSAPYGHAPAVTAAITAWAREELAIQRREHAEAERVEREVAE